MVYEVNAILQLQCGKLKKLPKIQITSIHSKIFSWKVYPKIIILQKYSDFNLNYKIKRNKTLPKRIVKLILKTRMCFIKITHL